MYMYMYMYMYMLFTFCLRAVTNFVRAVYVLCMQAIPGPVGHPSGVLCPSGVGPECACRE